MPENAASAKPGSSRHKYKTLCEKPNIAKNRVTKTSVDTMAFMVQEVEAWLLPPSQRGDIASFGVMDRNRYLIDGRQRRLAFLRHESSENVSPP